MALIDGLTDFSAAGSMRVQAWDEISRPSRCSQAIESRLQKIASLKPEAVKDTIFSRSPVFYSLVLVLDELSKLPSKADLEECSSTSTPVQRSSPCRRAPEERTLTSSRPALRVHNGLVPARHGRVHSVIHVTTVPPQNVAVPHAEFLERSGATTESSSAYRESSLACNNSWQS